MKKKKLKTFHWVVLSKSVHSRLGKPDFIKPSQMVRRKNGLTYMTYCDARGEVWKGAGRLINESNYNFCFDCFFVNLGFHFDHKKCGKGLK